VETGQPLATPLASPPTGLNFYRSHGRVVLLLFLAPVFYEFWWYWQLFSFTRREGFPRARRFWWIFVPIYDWFVLYWQFDDLSQAAARVGVPALNSALAIALLVFSWSTGSASNRISDPLMSLIAFIVSGILIAAVGYLVQPVANSYLKAKYQQAAPMRMTWGEITAAILGILLFVLAILGTFASTGSG
jgi:hypothetical protein